MKKFTFLLLAATTLYSANSYADNSEQKKSNRDCIKSEVASKRTSLKEIALTLRSCLDAASDQTAKKACRQTAKASREAQVESSRSALKNCRNASGI